MIALLASPLFRYGIAIAGVLAALGAIYAKGHSDGADRQIAIHEAYVRQEQANAAKLTAARIAENIALEAATEAHNAQLEETVANARAETASALDAYNAALRVRTRSVAACASPRAPDPGSAPSDQGLAPAGIFLSESSAGALGARQSAADDTEAVMTACKAWALEHGR